MTKLKVDGMTCNHCVQSVTKALGAIPGVDSVDVSLDRGEAVVEGTAGIGALVAALEQEGYKAEAAAS